MPLAGPTFRPCRPCGQRVGARRLVSTPVVHADGNQNGAGGTPPSVGGTSIRPHLVNARPQPIRGEARTHPSLEEVSISAAPAAIVPAPRRGRISSSAPQFFRRWASPTSYYGLWCLAPVAPSRRLTPPRPRRRQPAPEGPRRRKKARGTSPGPGCRRGLYASAAASSRFST